MPDTETIILAAGYVGIFGLMILNGTFSVPSSQILYIIVGYFVSTGRLGFTLAALVGALGNTIGCQILYEAVRRHGAGIAVKFGFARMEDLRKVEIAFERRGPWFIFVGKLLPAIKVFVPIPAALGKMRRDLFVLMMIVASFIWALGFIAIGYFFGKGAALWKSYGVILIIVAGTVVYLFYRYLNSPEILDQLEKEGPAVADAPTKA